MTGFSKHTFIALKMLGFICALISISALMGLASKAYAAEVAISPENFPDDVFREHIKTSYDTDGDEILSDAEISAVTFVDLGAMGIRSIEGIKHFTSCEQSQVKGGKLKTQYAFKKVMHHR